MAIKVTVKFPRAKITSAIVGQLNAILKKKDLNDQIGQIFAERIAFQAKRGRPLNDTGSFKPIKPSTIKNRKRLEKFNKTAAVYSPARSNLSFTGQLLESLSFRNLTSPGMLLEIFFKGARIPYRTGKDSVAKLGARNSTNEELAKVLREIGFTVFSKAGIEKNKQLIDRVTNTLKSYIRRNLK